MTFTRYFDILIIYTADKIDYGDKTVKNKIFILILCISVLLFGSCDTVMGREYGEWNSAFDRSGKINTWLCADGIYSVSLDGKDSIGSGTSDTSSFFIFSDSFIGSSLPSGRMLGESMVNHSAMLMRGNVPSSRNFEFFWGANGERKDNGNIFGEDRWMFDMLCDGENIYLFAFSHTDDWKPIEIDMYTVPVKNGVPDLSEYTVLPNISELICSTDTAQYVFGMAITPNTKTAGALDPDGYYYFYGFRDNLSYYVNTKDLLVSRIHEDAFPNFSELEYWNGSEWTDNITDSAPIIENVSCEMSITPIVEGAHAGRYIAVYTEMVSSPHMMYALGDSLTGPFDTPVEFYTAREAGADAEGGNSVLYTYNAKAHPHLSEDNLLLITYNVNTQGTAAENCRDYTPRFLFLDLNMEVPAVAE